MKILSNFKGLRVNILLNLFFMINAYADANENLSIFECLKGFKVICSKITPVQYEVLKMFKFHECQFIITNTCYEFL